MELQFAAKCIECKRLMRPGTEAGWIEDKGKYSYFHAESCPTDQPAVKKPRHTPDRDAEEVWSLRECKECGHLWAVPKGEFGIPTRCHDKRKEAV